MKNLFCRDELSSPAKKERGKQEVTEDLLGLTLKTPLTNAFEKVVVKWAGVPVTFQHFFP